MHSRDNAQTKQFEATKLKEMLDWKLTFTPQTGSLRYCSASAFAISTFSLQISENFQFFGVMKFREKKCSPDYGNASLFTYFWTSWTVLGVTKAMSCQSCGCAAPMFSACIPHINRLPPLLAWLRL